MRWEEVFGIVATLCIFIGFTRSQTTQIRIFNSIGSVLFIVYGVLIGAFSTWLLNAACLILNIYKIIKEQREDKYRPVQVLRPDESPDIVAVKIKK